MYAGNGLAVRVIPCLDVDDGRVVKGVNFANLRDAGDPVELAAAYDAGADGGGPDGPDPADVRTDRPAALAPEELAAWCDELAAGGPVLVVGDGAVRYVEQLAPRPGLDLGLAETVAAPSPAVLVRLAARRLAAGAPLQAATDIVPDYRRPADAKINWEERAPQRTAPPPPGDGR